MYSADVPYQRMYRSKSLHPLSQMETATTYQRYKRTFSLPNRDTLVPPSFFNFVDAHPREEEEDDEVDDDDTKGKADLYDETIMSIVGLSCSIVLYLWSCLIAMNASASDEARLS